MYIYKLYICKIILLSFIVITTACRCINVSKLTDDELCDYFVNNVNTFPESWELASVRGNAYLEYNTTLYASLYREPKYESYEIPEIENYYIYSKTEYSIQNITNSSNYGIQTNPLENIYHTGFYVMFIPNASDIVYMNVENKDHGNFYPLYNKMFTNPRTTKCILVNHYQSDKQSLICYNFINIEDQNEEYWVGGYVKGDMFRNLDGYEYDYFDVYQKCSHML